MPADRNQAGIELTGLLVLKLGGSLIESGQVRPWLQAAIRTAYTRPVVLVVGGGRLADAVREQQRELQYSDATAHRMAILAMQQQAWLVLEQLTELRALDDGPTAHQPPLMAAQSRTDFVRAASQRALAVWLPDAMSAASDIEKSWRVTSDALAVWLATELDAPALVIAKSAAVPADIAGNAGALADHGVLDTCCPAYLARYSGQWAIEADPVSLSGTSSSRRSY